MCHFSRQTLPNRTQRAAMNTPHDKKVSQSPWYAHGHAARSVKRDAVMGAGRSTCLPTSRRNLRHILRGRRACVCTEPTKCQAGAKERDSNDNIGPASRPVEHDSPAPASADPSAPASRPPPRATKRRAWAKLVSDRTCIPSQHSCAFEPRGHSCAFEPRSPRHGAHSATRTLTRRRCAESPWPWRRRRSRGTRAGCGSPQTPGWARN